MKTNDEFEEKPKETPITLVSINKYRDGIKGIDHTLVQATGLPRFDLLMEKWGFARINNGLTTVTNLLEFHYWMRVRNAVEDYDSAQYRYGMEMIDGEYEAHKKKIREWSAKLGEIFKVV